MHRLLPCRGYRPPRIGNVIELMSLCQISRFTARQDYFDEALCPSHVQYAVGGAPDQNIPFPQRTDDRLNRRRHVTRSESAPTRWQNVTDIIRKRRHFSFQIIRASQQIVRQRFDALSKTIARGGHVAVSIAMARDILENLPFLSPAKHVRILPNRRTAAGTWSCEWGLNLTQSAYSFMNKPWCLMS